MKNFKRNFLSLLVLGFVALSTFTGCKTDTPPKVTTKVTALSALAGDAQVTLKWKNPTSEDFDFNTVYYGTSKEDISTSFALGDKNATSCLIESLTNGTKYYFRIDSTMLDGTVNKSAVVTATPANLYTISSVDFAKSMVIGWNLGNTLDANSETGWGMPMTTEAMIKEVHKAGFEAIRIPVSWHWHVSGSNNEINSTWMARVKTIVDWAYNDGMYVILNIHHDNMSVTEINSTPGFALSKDASIQTKSKKYIADIWTQIATTFADYDNHLVYEVLNEPRDIGGAVWGNEWWCGGTSGKEVCKVITDYEQVAINTIRGIAGNENRFIMVPGYAASGSDSTMLACYTMPTDTASDKLILSGHAYTPYPFAMDSLADTTFDSSDQTILDDMFNKLATNYIKKGIGIVMGEASASDKGNLNERIKWAKYYFGKAKETGIPVILWDNMVLYKNSHDPAESHGYFDRKNLKWFTPTLVEAMITAAGGTPNLNGGSDDTTGADPEPEKPTEMKGTVVFSGSLDMKETDWSVNTTIGESKFSTAKSTSTLYFETAPCSNPDATYYNIKLQDGDWSTVFSAGTAINGSVADEVIVPNKATGIVAYTPTSEEWSSIKSKGLVVYGFGLKITKITFE